MKYLPLIWAALRRKPLRAVLTLLSVTTAFTLFGLMIGLNASFQHLADMARGDRLFVNARFGGFLPVAVGQKLLRLEGVNHVGYGNWIGGYYQDPKNFVSVGMEDDSVRDIVPEMLTPAQFDRLHKSRTGVIFSRMLAERWHKKAGDRFTMVAQAPKADGTLSWDFTVLEVVDDIPSWAGGFIFGNYDYYNQSVPAKDRNMTTFFELTVKDPDRADATAQAIDAMFANSATPTRSISERAAYQSSAQSGVNIGAVTRLVAAAGLFMILFLTGNGIAQSVRERIGEFAVMKTLGFSDAGVIALVFAEAAIPCLGGAILGMALASALSSFLPGFIPPGWSIPPPTMSSAVITAGLVCAALVAFVSAILPALRLKRLDVATALAGR